MGRAFQVASVALFAAWLAQSALGEPRDGGRNEYGVFRLVSPKRFIPLSHPKFISADDAKLDDEQRVIGLVVGGDARCYPLRQMWYHHIANDTVGGIDVAVTFCIMADTVVTYLRETPEDELVVAGLYGGVLAMRRKGTDDVFAQIAPVPVPDNPTSLTLRLGPTPLLTTFGRWKAAHPDTQVLAPDKEFSLFYEAYDQKPKGYNANPLMNETVVNRDLRLKAGDEVFGVAVGDESCAWTLSLLKESRRVEGRIGSTSFTILWDESFDTPRIEGDFKGLSMRSFWYAWSSFYPRTQLVAAPAKEKSK